MGRHRSTEMLLFLVLLCACISNMSGITFGCIEKERQALLNLKQSFQDPSHKLSSWQGQDCCQWKGVACNQTTGHIVKLHLRSSSMDFPYSNLEYEYYYEDYYQWFTTHLPDLQANELSSNLLELQHLNYLDLSGNNFSYSKIPNFFGSMKNLKYLNLSHAHFGGLISLQFANLTSLQVLDLQGLYDVSTRTFQWASNLLSLQYLDMNSVNCSNASDLMQVLTNLPSLSHINLYDCSLNMVNFPWRSINSTFSASVRYLDLSDNHLGRSILNDLKNMTSLEVLDLSSTFYATSSSIPTWLGDLKSLVYLNLAWNNYDSFEGEGGLLYIINNACSLKLLDLSFNYIREVLEPHQNPKKCVKYNLEILNLEDNKMGGPLPDWSEQLKFSRYLGLSWNLFHGPTPSSLGKLSFLKVLDLSANQLIGSIPESLGRLSSLRRIDLSDNGLTGIIPKSIGRMSVLECLALSYNNLNGVIPKTLGKLSLVLDIDLSRNQLNGSLPKSIGKLEFLQSLDISSNLLEGIVSEDHFANLTRLDTLLIDSNNFSCQVNSNWIPPFSLYEINMASCKVVGSHGVPQWLQTQRNVVHLNLSNANIIGTFPKWLRNMSSIDSLDLSMNQISGHLPMSIGSLSSLLHLNLGNNLINGSLPDSLCGLEYLRTLDLSRNKLYGILPNCWRGSQYVEVINLSYNKLSGTIPSSMGNLSELMRLHMNNNNFNGELPLPLRSCSKMKILDLGDNNFSGPLPTWIGGHSFRNIRILRLRKNMFSGSIPLNFCKLLALSILDLANNNLRGEIPHCFAKLTGMIVVKNYSSITKLSAPGPDDGGLERAKVSQVLKGRDLEYTKTLLLLDNLDLSSNKLVGIIPEELCVLSALRGLNLSHNHLSGNIPNNIEELKSLESLDLSNNKLVGAIPQSMANLMSLNKLDLSYNNLSGKIPTGPQLQTLNDPNIYAGNDELCGDPLPKNCSGDDDRRKNAHEDDDDYKESRIERIWFYCVVTLGYAVGLWGVIGSLVFNRNWRHAFFRFTENTMDWIHVRVEVKIGRLKKSIMKWTN